MIDQACLQLFEAGEGGVGVREQEATAGGIAGDGDGPVANAPLWLVVPWPFFDS